MDFYMSKDWKGAGNEIYKNAWSRKIIKISLDFAAKICYLNFSNNYYFYQTKYSNT